MPLLASLQSVIFLNKSSLSKATTRLSRVGAACVMMTSAQMQIRQTNSSFIPLHRKVNDNPFCTEFVYQMKTTTEQIQMDTFSGKNSNAIH